MSAIQLYTDILQQVKDIQVRLQAIEKGAQPSVPEAERLSVQLHEFQKMLAAYVFLKEHGERFVEEHLKSREKKEEPPTVKVQPVLNMKPTMVSVTQQPPLPREEPKQPEPIVEMKKEEPVATVIPPKPEPVQTPTPPVPPQEKIDIPQPKVTVSEPPPARTPAGPKLEIGLNDKFRMINELFKSNQPEYNIAIEQLNNSASWEDARVYLNGLRLIYSWDDEHAMVKLIYQLARKRFS